MILKATSPKPRSAATGPGAVVAGRVAGDGAGDGAEAEVVVGGTAEDARTVDDGGADAPAEALVAGDEVDDGAAVVAGAEAPAPPHPVARAANARRAPHLLVARRTAPGGRPGRPPGSSSSTSRRYDIVPRPRRRDVQVRPVVRGSPAWGPVGERGR